MSGRHSGEIFIYGINPVAELLKSSIRPKEILLELNKADARITEIEQMALNANVKVRRLPAKTMETIAKNQRHQGVIAAIREIRPAKLEDVAAKGEKDGTSALIIMLDGVEDPQNLGAVIRTAECMGAAGVVIPSHRSASLGPGAMKSSAGAVAHIPVAVVSNVAQAILDIKEYGYRVVGFEGGTGRAVEEADLTGKTALVLGGEGTGLRRLVRERCDEVVFIPMTGRLNSLNVSAAAAMAMFEYRRRNPGKKH